MDTLQQDFFTSSPQAHLEWASPAEKQRLQSRFRRVV